MKLTDFALIFVVVFLPIVIIAYVNTTFAVKAEKNEMYYKSIINSATQDAVTAMKEVEGSNIDYGYSGIVNNKISINAHEAINTFYNSLSRNFGIDYKSQAMERLKMYIPVIAVMDYDGIHIHSAEMISGQVKFVTKPKIKYTLNYVIEKRGSLAAGYTYKLVEISPTAPLTGRTLLSKYLYEVSFTMDDYISLNIYKINTGEIAVTKGFYLTDTTNNKELVFGESILSYDETKLRADIVEYLAKRRNEIISETAKKHLSYAVNKHNEYAGTTDIKYEFRLNVDEDVDFEESIHGIGLIAVIQGVSLGNRYLNYKAYSTSELAEAKKYYVSTALTGEELDSYTDYIKAETYLKYNLYHSSIRCMIYEYYKGNIKDLVLPEYYLSRADAATQGYYPCPICKP